MTAPAFEQNTGGGVGRACAAAADGRRAARALGQWCERFALTEPEFQVLWCLRDEDRGGFDQTTLARRLAYSTAQVSATVEKLRARSWITQQAVGGDRRRNLWRLSTDGASAVATMLQTAHELGWPTEIIVELTNAATQQREAA